MQGTKSICHLECRKLVQTIGMEIKKKEKKITMPE